MARLSGVKLNSTSYPVKSDFTAVITTTWTGTEAPYTQDITVTGLQANDTPIVDLVPSSTYATAKNEIKNYAKIYRMVVSAANTLTVYSTDTTTVALNIKLRCL